MEFRNSISKCGIWINCFCFSFAFQFLNAVCVHGLWFFDVICVVSITDQQEFTNDCVNGEILDEIAKMLTLVRSFEIVWMCVPVCVSVYRITNYWKLTAYLFEVLLRRILRCKSNDTFAEILFVSSGTFTKFVLVM